ncbi:MAG: aldolase/citrate lyase family protein [Trueperaceae bacterium]
MFLDNLDHYRAGEPRRIVVDKGRGCRARGYWYSPEHMIDLRKLAQSRTPILNGWLSIPSSVVAEVMARQGFHSICIDMQHGLIDYGDCVPMLQAIGQTTAAPLVRVPSQEPAMMMKVLDAGAAGVIVPLVDNLRQAATAVAACRYPPQGRRSFGPTRAALVAGSDYHLSANYDILVFAMIETVDGLANLQEIVCTPGLDGIYIGPSDLSYALGLPPRMDNDHPDHLAAVELILNSCREQSLIVGIHTADPEFAQGALQRGADMVTIATDIACMRQEAQRRLSYF